MSDKIGICIAGYGGFAKKQLRPRLLKIEDCEVRKLYHPDSAKASEYGALGSSNLEELLADESVRAFVIASPNDKHYELLYPLLQAKKHHIFVEKPIVDTLMDLESLRRFAVNYPKVFMVGHCQRRESVYRKAKEMLGDGLIGKPVSVDFNVSSGKAFDMKESDWRMSEKRTPLGPLAMVGSHCIDTIHYLFGKVSSVFAKFDRVSGKTDAPDSSFVMMNLESGVTALLQCHYSVPREKYCLISGTEGAIYIRGDKIFLRSGREKYKDPPTESQEWHTFKNDPIDEELREFISAIRDGSVEVETGYREGEAVMRVMDACRISAEESKLIPV